jgi:hypothetical protein
LPILPLAEKCSECEHYYICPVTKIIRDRDCNGIAITYQKLVALMLASAGRPKTTAKDILDNIRSVRNFIFDEIHEIQYGRSTELTVYDDSRPRKWIDLDRFLGLVEDFPQRGNHI